MSSDYRLICLNHDPAIVVGDIEWMTRAEALFAARHRDDHEALTAHTACDLVIGRYSYPLVEVGCPHDGVAGGHLARLHDADGLWIDARWMRLILAAYASGDAAAAMAASEVGVCWTPERTHRLRLELRWMEDR